MARRHRKPRPDLDERVSLHPEDPEDVLRKILRQPPLDKREEREETEEPTKP
jgi:hypothetical protein